MPEMQEAVVVATARSPIGRANKGSLVDVRADYLMADIIKAVLAKAPGLDPNDIVDVICGNVAQSGETGFNIARTAGILAGLPLSVPGQTVQRFCSSSLLAISAAANSIKVGEGDVYVACGVEKTSRPPAPEGAEGGGGGGRQRPAFGGPDNPKNVGGINLELLGRTPGLPNVYIPMGMTAENVVEKFGVKREDMDRFAKLSQDRAVAAQNNGVFDREITPVTKDDGTVVAKDDGPRADTTLEKLASLQPSFKPDGSVTAGNSCPLNDGAAAVLLMSPRKAHELGLKPLARIIATAVS